MYASRFPSLVAALCALTLQAPAAAAGAGEALQVVTVERIAERAVHLGEGRVEALRHSAIASQLAGAIVELRVKAGDSVRAGQVLARIDARTAQQQVAASAAQATAAQARQESARREYERQQRLFAKNYLSQAAMERAEAQFKVASAEARAGHAQAGVAQAQSALHTLLAPYEGVVATVSAEQGEMAQPGQALLELYDPARLRVSLQVPEQSARRITVGAPADVLLPTGRTLSAAPISVLPSADPQTHTVEVRLPLPQAAGLVPGNFVRVRLPLAPGGAGEGVAGFSVPGAAIVRRGELQAVYVVAASGRAALRQVRLGRPLADDRIEILAGLGAGERVSLNPRAAARQPQGSVE